MNFKYLSLSEQDYLRKINWRSKDKLDVNNESEV
jgi:hypothetical protein